MDLRHEWKHRINVEDLILLRQTTAAGQAGSLCGRGMLSYPQPLFRYPFRQSLAGEAGWGQWPGEVSYPLLQQRLLFDSSGEEKQAEWFGA